MPTLRTQTPARNFIDSAAQTLKEFKTYDETRSSFPGEHLIVAGTGLAVLWASSRSDSSLKRAIGSAVGIALLARAASGRDGVAKLLPYLPALPAVKKLIP